MTLESAVGRGISGIREKSVRPFSPIVILNLFQDLTFSCDRNEDPETSSG
jgi:hypothetical protein